MQRIDRNSIRALLLSAMFGAVAAVGATAQDAGPVGDWEGAITAGGQSIDVSIYVSANEDGSLTATMDVPSQGGMDIPLEDVAFADGVLTFGLSVVPGGASYSGKISDDGSALTGTWTQGGNDAELNLTKAEG